MFVYCTYIRMQIKPQKALNTQYLFPPFTLTWHPLFCYLYWSDLYINNICFESPFSPYPTVKLFLILQNSNMPSWEAFLDPPSLISSWINAFFVPRYLLSNVPLYQHIPLPWLSPQALPCIIRIYISSSPLNWLLRGRDNITQEV